MASYAFEIDSIIKTFCSEMQCKESQLKKMLIKKADIMEKMKENVIDKANLTYIIAELMSEAKEIKAFTGEQKKACVMMITETILASSQMVDDKLDQIKDIVPSMIDNFSILLKNKKRNLLEYIFKMLTCTSSR